MTSQASLLLVVSIGTGVEGPLEVAMVIFRRQDSLLLQFRQPEILLANGWTLDHSEIKPRALSQNDRLQVQLDSDTL